MGYDILLNQALKLHETGKLNEAENIYRQILETAPKNPDILNLLGLIAQAKGIHSEAINFFYKAIKETPNFAPLHFNLALSLEADNKPVEAIEAYEKALKLNPELKEAYNNLGRITNKAEHYEKALQIDPDYLEAKANLALLNNDIETLKNINDPHSLYYLSKITTGSEAIEYAQRADKIIENDEIKSQLGSLYLEEGNFKKAKQLFEKATEINPKHLSALTNLANIETNNKNYQKAEELYKKALNLDSNSLDTHLNYANMLYQQKRLPEALEEYRKAVILNPDKPEISNNLGIILKDIGEYEEALGLFFNAFLKNPNIEETSLNIFETLQIFSKIDEKSLENARKIAKNWQKEAKNNIFAQNILNILEGKDIENNQVFYKRYFEHFADDFDAVLKNISYATARRIGDIASSVKGTIIDLGCGSGNVGSEIRGAREEKSPQTNTNQEKNKIIGVDLSPKMLEIAQNKNVYDELIESDILSYELKEKPELIVSADVFCYFGNLEPLIKKYAGNNLCFSTETDQNIDSYKLDITGRYKHNPQYVEELLKKYGYSKIKQENLIIRKEDNQPVEGTIFYCLA